MSGIYPTDIEATKRDDIRFFIKELPVGLNGGFFVDKSSRIYLIARHGINTEELENYLMSEGQE